MSLVADGKCTDAGKNGSTITRAKALEWVARTFETSAHQITEATAREKIAAWDSLGMLTLMAGLDQDFKIVLSDNEIRSMRSVADILAILTRNGKLSD